MSSDNEDTMSICSSSASITSSVLSCPSSIIDEIQQLIDNFEETYKYLHDSIHTLNSIRDYICNSSDIKISINNIQYDLDDLIETIHLKSLEKIREIGEMNFGEELLKILEKEEVNVTDNNTETN
jgi:hypothetical protein